MVNLKPGEATQSGRLFAGMSPAAIASCAQNSTRATRNALVASYASALQALHQQAASASGLPQTDRAFQASATSNALAVSPSTNAVAILVSIFLTSKAFCHKS